MRRDRKGRTRFRDRRHLELFDRGYAIGTHCPITYEETQALARQAIRATLALPAEVEGRPPPCPSCTWIGLCSSTGSTCSQFRAWVSSPQERKMRPSDARRRISSSRDYSQRVVARVPDRTWQNSFGTEDE